MASKERKLRKEKIRSLSSVCPLEAKSSRLSRILTGSGTDNNIMPSPLSVTSVSSVVKRISPEPPNDPRFRPFHPFSQRVQMDFVVQFALPDTLEESLFIKGDKDLPGPVRLTSIGPLCRTYPRTL